jgi:NADPH2:quinone reductase
MKAVTCEQWGGPELLRIVERDLPSPGPGQVRIRVRAAGVNFPDVLIIQKKYQIQPELPFIPGAEIAGDVIEAGDGAPFASGDRVVAFCGQGGFAEEVTVAADACHKLPDAVGYEPAAALLLAYGTSWHALRDRAKLVAGETLLVLGASGGVGLAAVEIGHAMGARVIAAASTPEKLAVCTARGADATIDYTAEKLRDGIARVCGKRGPDVIYDPVGGDLAEPAFRSIGWNGRYLVVGFAGGNIPALPLNLPLLKGASLVGVFWGGRAKAEPEAHRASVLELLEWLAAGKLSPLVSRSYTLEQAPDALRDMAARRVTGKIVITP